MVTIARCFVGSFNQNSLLSQVAFLPTWEIWKSLPNSISPGMNWKLRCTRSSCIPRRDILYRDEASCCSLGFPRQYHLPPTKRDVRSILKRLFAGFLIRGSAAGSGDQISYTNETVCMCYHTDLDDFSSGLLRRFVKKGGRRFSCRRFVCCHGIALGD